MGNLSPFTSKLIKLTLPNEQNCDDAKVNKSIELVRSHLQEYLFYLKEDYIKLGLTYLEELIFSDVEQVNDELLEKILIATEFIISGLIASGFSMYELQQHYRHVLTKAKSGEGFTQRFAHLSSIILQEEENYQIQLSVKNKEFAERVGLFGEWVFGSLMLKKATEKEVIATIEVAAKSRVSAGVKAHEKLGEVLDALSFAFPNINLSVSKTFSSLDVSTGKEKSLPLHSLVPNHIHKMNDDELQRFVVSLNSSLTDTKLAGM